MKSTDTFDKLVNSLLEENYFGGSPYERASRIKKHVTFEDASDGESERFDAEQDFTDDTREWEDTAKVEEPEDKEGELGRELKRELDSVEDYGYGDKSGNPGAQLEQDEILGRFLDGLDIIRVGRHHGAIGGEMIVYSIPDEIKDDFHPYTLVAYSEKDLGEAAELFPLDKFYSVMLGTPTGERNGVPILKNKFYDGPAVDIKSLSNKEPEGKRVTGHAPGRLDYDQIRAAVAAARSRGDLR